MCHYRNFLSLVFVLPAIALLGRGIDATSQSAAGAGAETKVLICHNAGPSKQIEIEVNESAVAAHIEQHGDTVGACSGVPEDTFNSR
ncbi:MAG TPA: hypothetical protein VF309_07710 [Usitatibacter sp.]